MNQIADKAGVGCWVGGMIESFVGRQARSVGNGFAQAATESGYKILACSILPDHVHTVILRSGRDIRRMVGHLKARATKHLRQDGLHPLVSHIQPDGSIPSPWAQKAWHVYVNSPQAVDRAIRYVQQNPIKEGKPRQTWRFVRDV